MFSNSVGFGVFFFFFYFFNINSAENRSNFNIAIKLVLRIYAMLYKFKFKRSLPGARYNLFRIIDKSGKTRKTTIVLNELNKPSPGLNKFLTFSVQLKLICLTI